MGAVSTSWSFTTLILATLKGITLYLCSAVETKFSSGGLLTSQFAARACYALWVDDATLEVWNAKPTPAI